MSPSSQKSCTLNFGLQWAVPWVLFVLNMLLHLNILVLFRDYLWKWTKDACWTICYFPEQLKSSYLYLSSKDFCRFVITPLMFLCCLQFSFCFLMWHPPSGIFGNRACLNHFLRQTSDSPLVWKLPPQTRLLLFCIIGIWIRETDQIILPQGTFNFPIHFLLTLPSIAPCRP